MHSNGTLGDCQSQTCTTTTLSITCIFCSIEWSEDLFKRFFGNAISAITNTDHCEMVVAAVLLSKCNFNRSTLRRIANSITHHVLDGASQQFFDTINRAIVTRDNLHRAIQTSCFKISILGNIPHKLGEIDIAPFPSIGSTLKTRERQQLTDHLVEIV